MTKLEEKLKKYLYLEDKNIIIEEKYIIDISDSIHSCEAIKGTIENVYVDTYEFVFDYNPYYRPFYDDSLVEIKYLDFAFTEIDKPHYLYLRNLHFERHLNLPDTNLSSYRLFRRKFPPKVFDEMLTNNQGYMTKLEEKLIDLGYRFHATHGTCDKTSKIFKKETNKDKIYIDICENKIVKIDGKNQQEIQKDLEELKLCQD